jgi:TolB-like protein/Flp pilus assembly protein TadD
MRFAALTKFFSELRRRKVLRIAAVYLLIAWLLIQVAEATFEPLQLPGWSLTLVIALAALGFPLALVLGWAYEITADGVTRDPRDTGPDAQRLAEPPDAEAGTLSIAVLPFADMSPEQDQAYFCDGVAEEIGNTLGSIPGLRVASRTAASQFRHTGADIPEIGRRLKVQRVLEGSVRKSANKLRVNAHLVDVGAGHHVWSGRFDVSLSDVFSVQEQIAEDIASALRLQLAPEQRETLRRSQTRSVEAYDYYLRAWSFFHRLGRRNMEYARGLFRQAIEVDPEYARAWAGLADAAAFIYTYARKDEAYRKEATEASCRAVELCPDLAEARASRGLAHMLCQEFEQAEAEFRKALELDPDQYEALYFYARACVHQGKYEQAAELFARAMRVRPEDYQAALLLPQMYQSLGLRDQEIAALRHGIDVGLQHIALNPDEGRTIIMVGCAYAKLGDKAKAREQAERVLALQPEDEAIQYNTACLYAQIGDAEAALDCLENANLPGMANRGWVEHDADLTPLHGHPRFQAILDQLSY